MKKVRVTFQVEKEMKVEILKRSSQRGLSSSAWFRYIMLDVLAGKKPTP